MCMTYTIHTHLQTRYFMRTNIVIEDSLMKKAMRCGGYKTKRETISAALHLLIQLKLLFHCLQTHLRFEHLLAC